MLRKYISFSGRLNRKVFILYSLSLFLVSFLFFSTVSYIFEKFLMIDINAINSFAGAQEQLTTFPVLILAIITIIFLVAMKIAAISLSVRRLHDLNRTGLWMLLGMIPGINILMIFLVIYLILAKGTTGRNKYGPDPLGYYI